MCRLVFELPGDDVDDSEADNKTHGHPPFCESVEVGGQLYNMV